MSSVGRIQSYVLRARPEDTAEQFISRCANGYESDCPVFAAGSFERIWHGLYFACHKLRGAG